MSGSAGAADQAGAVRAVRVMPPLEGTRILGVAVAGPHDLEVVMIEPYAGLEREQAEALRRGRRDPALRA